MENQTEGRQIAIKDGDIFLYPITTPESVIDPESGKNIKDLISEIIVTTLNTPI